MNHMTHVIRTPHGLLDLRAIAADWERAQRANREYEAHPFAGHTDRYLTTCHHCQAAKETR